MDYRCNFLSMEVSGNKLQKIEQLLVHADGSGTYTKLKGIMKIPRKKMKTCPVRILQVNLKANHGSLYFSYSIFGGRGVRSYSRSYSQISL